MRYGGSRRRRVSVHSFLIACAIFTGFGLVMLSLRSVDPPPSFELPPKTRFQAADSSLWSENGGVGAESPRESERGGRRSCATVEEMGEAFEGDVWKASLRVRKMIQDHFALNGPLRVRGLPPEQFCKHGFVIGKASEAGFGNEMYKILTAAALSVMLNRSLIIGQTRHIGSSSSLSVLYSNLCFLISNLNYLQKLYCGYLFILLLLDDICFKLGISYSNGSIIGTINVGCFMLPTIQAPYWIVSSSRRPKVLRRPSNLGTFVVMLLFVLIIALLYFFRGKYPFGDYISYSNLSFSLNEVKHLWRQSGCVKKYERHLVMRIDDFEKPSKSNVLCGNWREWKQPIIWFQNTTDAVAAQFFLKNVHHEMRNAASDLFGQPETLQSRPNVFGELMRVLISPSEDVKEAINSVLGVGEDPDISLHMRMLMNRSVRAVQAALNCIKKSMRRQHLVARPRVVLVSDTPSLIKTIAPNISEFAEVLHFDYKLFKGNISRQVNGLHSSDFRVKDWGPAPRWVAFVDFFLASRAKHVVVSGAHRRVGTTYAQLIAALAAAHSLGDNSTGSKFSFLSSFQANLLSEGLKNQVGWGHVWNRFAGPLSCHSRLNQCAYTPLLPPAWWDGLWQSPIPRDIRRLAAYGIELSGFGTADESHLQSFCNSRKNNVRTVMIL